MPGRQGTRESGRQNWARRRFGVDFERPDGMHPDVDPGAIAPNAFRHLENIDFRGNKIKPREGEQKVNTTAIYSATACVGIGFDHQQTPHRLYIIAQGCPGVSTTVGRSIGWYDPDFTGSAGGGITGLGFQRMLYLDYSTLNATLGTFGDELYAGVDTQLKRIARIEPKIGTEPITTVGARQDTTILNLIGYTIKALREFDGKLFISAENIATPTSSIVYVWDGLVVKEDITGIRAPTYMVEWRDKLALGTPSADNLIRLREKGDAPGSYSTVAPGAGTVATYRMVSHLNNLYITDGGANLWKYDGSSLAIFRTPTNSSLMRGLESFNGFLYYGWKNSVSGAAILGRWSEASVFDDTHLNFTTTFANTSQVDELRRYRDRLLALLFVSSTASRLVESAGLVTGSAFVEVDDLDNLGYEMVAF